MKAPNRGGVAIYAKYNLSSDLIYDLRKDDEVWFYPNAFASIQSHCATNCLKQHILVGDFNARLGTAVNELAEITENISYERIDHSPRNDNPSPHGRRLLQICHDNKLLVINNLRYGANQWKGSLKYRMRDSW